MTAPQIRYVPRADDPRNGLVTLLSPSAEPQGFSLAKWTLLLGLVTDGKKTADAIVESGLSRAVVEGTLRAVPERLVEWNKAKHCRARLGWDIEAIEDLLAMVASGTHTVVEGCDALGKNMTSFYKLVLSDEDVRTFYEEAQRIRVLEMAEQLRAIADDKGDDMDLNGRGNVAAVNRAKLQVDTRLRLAQVWYPKVFNAKQMQDVNVNVNIDHAARLDAARTRRDKGVVLEGEYTPVPKAIEERAPWDDAP